jgi:hypothetical protein
MYSAGPPCTDITNQLRQIAAREARDLTNVEIEVLLTYILQLLHDRALTEHLIRRILIADSPSNPAHFANAGKIRLPNCVAARTLLCRFERMPNYVLGRLIRLASCCRNNIRARPSRYTRTQDDASVPSKRAFLHDRCDHP